MNFLLNLLPTIAGVILGICYIPQIVKTLKTKNVEGMSLPFWVLLNIALTLLVINAFVVFTTSGVWGYLVTEIFNEVLALVMLILVVKYRERG
ncbi:MAG TPA: PQ-loop domain-containing transporter [Pseudoneobacillus sp.]|nr:PQ-loop domain-containing transporter [Pseudoneobacillus sp.]